MAPNAKLSSLAKEWKAAEAILPSYSSVPEGDYVGALREMKVDEAKKTGRLQAVTTFEIVDGEYEGQTVRRFDGLVDKQSMGYFKGLAEIMGMELPEDLELLQETMDAFVENCGDLFNIHVAKSKSDEGKDYTNVYVNGISEFVMGDGAVAEEGQEEVVEEGQEEVVEEEIIEEEVAEEGAEEVVEEVIEEEPQQITAPMKRFSAKPAQQATAKVQQKPVQQKTAATVKATTVKPVTRPTVVKAAQAPAAPPKVKTSGVRIAAKR